MQKSDSMPIELTQGQISLWTGQKLNPETPLHNNMYAFKIGGAIDQRVFKVAFNIVIQKVDALRTVFSEENNIPYQNVLDKLDYDLEVFDFSKKDDLFIKNWISERAKKMLLISKCSFDAALIKAKENQYIWLLNMHHLITDSVAMSIVFDMTQKQYSLIKSSKPIQLEDTPLFNDYVNFEKESRKNSKNLVSQTYWSEKVNALNEIPRLYGSNSGINDTDASRIKLEIGNERLRKLRALAQSSEVRSWSENLTFFNIFSALIFVYMSRVSGQEKLAIGAPYHNRINKKFQQTVGYLIQVFPIVAKISQNETFKMVLKGIQLETNTYLQHAKPGMATPEISRSFNVILNYITTSFSNFNGLPTTTEWVHNGHIDSSHAMRCHVTDFDETGELQILLDLNHGVFDERTIEKAPGHFLNLLDAFIEDIETPIGAPSLLGPADGAQYSTEAMTKAPLLTLEQFDRAVQLHSGQNAVRNGNVSYSYKEINEKANQLAHFLQKRGIGHGLNVGLYMRRSEDYLISILAVLKIGCTFIPIPSDQPIERIKFIISDANCAILLSHSELSGNIKNCSISIMDLDREKNVIKEIASNSPTSMVSEKDVAYILYTSGSTGNPKGVLISHGALANYLTWAKSYYKTDDPLVFPLFTSIGFDLTITSTFLPLISGGELIVYKESNSGPDISLLAVLEENRVNSIKLTPSHLALIQGNSNSTSLIKTMIVGGEDFKTKIASSIQESFGKDLRIFNEYGPTESTVGCIVSRFDKYKHTDTSVPIGLPIDCIQAYILDDYMNLVPKGVIGSLYIGGKGLAEGYLNLPELTTEKFIANPFNSDEKLYQTGDLARINSDGEYEYLGRIDEQVKLRGFRIELTDIEANLLKHESIENTAVVVIENEKAIPENEVVNCSECGLPSNYPNTDFDENGVCHICSAFKGYKEQAQRYFKTEDELRNILISQRGKNPNYDCISLLSGGKDSTYILAQLISMGLKVLAFTLDNGYISDQAKGNINRIVSKLNVDHVYGTTEHMNKIFVDSLHRHHNVCNGCFKTIYTLATQIALEKQIPYVVTGLSRGQFFETRLTEELFWDENVDVSTIDDTILEARKLYHQEEDAVKTHLDVSMFDYEDTFSKVQFIDFYRYSDVSLEEMLKFLKEKVDWVRPTDTGRSTNCLINQVGIYVHKKEKGYSNYSFPYSWDVRMGHKTRTETLEEINEVIDKKEVKRIIDEIGYQESFENGKEEKQLVGFYTGKQKVKSNELTNHLSKELPEYMIPNYFKHIEELPLTANGKVDKPALKALNFLQLDMDSPFVAPTGEIEVLLASIWKEVLRLERVGVHDSFIALGGHSLAAIRITARVNEEIETKFPLNKIFELPTISEYAKYIEKTLLELLQG